MTDPPRFTNAIAKRFLKVICDGMTDNQQQNRPQLDCTSEACGCDLKLIKRECSKKFADRKKSAISALQICKFP
jgi:hypothetical protein